MRIEGTYMLGTVREIAEFIVRNISYKNTISSKNSRNFQNVDFTIPDNYEDNDSLDEICHNSSAWYGIKNIKTDFNSDDWDIMVNYYGGGSGQYVQCYDGEEVLDAIKEIMEAIIDSLELDFETKSETILIAELVN